MEEAIKKADVLIEALPYIKRFQNKTFVIKYGGSILSESSIRESVLEDIVFLHFMGIDVVLVHGGGPHISARLKDRNIPSEFFEGIRVTSPAALSVVEEELSELNQMLQREISGHNAKAKGFAGKDDIIFVKKKRALKDLGLVGEVCGINTEKLNTLIHNDHLVIISPTGINQESGVIYNVNADSVAASVAGSLHAEKFVFLTDVAGILRDAKDPSTLISSMKRNDVTHLVDAGIISGGMIPKVMACTEALEKGVKKVHIIDAKIPHAILLEIFTDRGVGTEIIV